MFYLIFQLFSFLLLFLIPLLLLSLFLYTSDANCYLQAYQGMGEKNKRMFVAIKEKEKVASVEQE